MIQSQIRCFGVVTVTSCGPLDGVTVLGASTEIDFEPFDIEFILNDEQVAKILNSDFHLGCLSLATLLDTVKDVHVLSKTSDRKGPRAKTADYLRRLSMVSAGFSQPV